MRYKEIVRGMIDIERILISGIGVVSPIGINTQDFYNSLIEEKYSHTIEKTAFPGHGDDKNTARLTQKQMEEIDNVLNESSKMPNTVKFAVYAAGLALKDAGLDETSLSNKKVAVIIGNNDAEADVFDSNVKNEQFVKYGYTSYHISKGVSDYYNLNALNFCVHNTCASSNMAIDLAYTFLKSKQVDVVIAGGADSFSLKNYSGFNSLMALSKSTCRPFSSLRDGITITEGAGIFVLERESDLAKRKNIAYCEVLGVGSSNDAHHLTQPDKHGILLAVEKAFKYSGITYRDVDYIMAHGTGTITNDKTESSVINTVYPEKENLKGVCSIKGTIGHMMGAAGAVAVVAICMIYKNGVLPPSSKSIPKDEECDINVITEATTDNNIGIFVNHSFGFGGNNSVAVFRNYMQYTFHLY
jgi:3-oxoacyl-[acyl-carrier-protein] synthase II